MALGFFISRMISNPVKELIANIDNADIHNQFNSTRKDEIGGLQRSFDKFVTSIKDTLVQVSEASAAVASASTEISSSTEQMAAGSQEQSSQAAEVATAVEEMTKTLGETNGNIRKVADGAKSAKDGASEGGAVVEDTIKGMKRISDVVNQSAEQVKVLGASSEKIGEIVSVINDIADQTNLLALNAAIEAARAGEQGQGLPRPEPGDLQLDSRSGGDRGPVHRHAGDGLRDARACAGGHHRSSLSGPAEDRVRRSRQGSRQLHHHQPWVHCSGRHGT